MNEGDPVPQAQEEFIKVLIRVYLASKEEVETNLAPGIDIPRGHFRASGHPVILMDADPDDLEAEGFEAYTTTSESVEKMLFGNPLVHMRADYVERVKQLAAASGLEDVTDGEVDKELSVEVIAN